MTDLQRYPINYHPINNEKYIIFFLAFSTTNLTVFYIIADIHKEAVIKKKKNIF